MKRDYGTYGNNGTNGKDFGFWILDVTGKDFNHLNLTVFCYFRIFRNLSSCLLSFISILDLDTVPSQQFFKEAFIIEIRGIV
jgi:hypothetical protein